MADSICNKCNMEISQEWFFCPHCSSNILLHADAQTTGIHTHLEGQIIPFYETLINRLRMPYYLSCLLFCLPFLILHMGLGILFKVDIFADCSWLLSLMIGYTLLLVVWNTKKLRKLTLNLFAFNELETEDFYATIVRLLQTILSNKNLVIYGISFGFLNTAFGLAYGIWYANPFLAASILLQFFVEGFICGMAICGIVGVVKMINTFSALDKIAINYRAPDKCGGISIIGNHLLYFSITSLSVGVLISLYIYLTPWTHRTQDLVKFSIYAWMAFPHFAAISVLLIPMLKLHHMLEKLKHGQDLLLLKSCAGLRSSLDKLLNPSAPKEFQQFSLGVMHYTHLTDMHAKVNSLCTWPFDSRSGLIYVAGFLVSALVPISQLITVATTYKTILK
jgi:hypothetical protein